MHEICPYRRRIPHTDINITRTRGMIIIDGKFLPGFSSVLLSITSRNPVKFQGVVLRTSGLSTPSVEGLSLLNLSSLCSCHLAREEQMLDKHLFELSLISYISQALF